MPMSAFAWAHADHYALAQGFVDNGFDFFHPKTFSLNPGLPPEVELKDPKGITACDFPIFYYIVAIGFKLTGSVSPLIYRLITLLFSFLSFLFLYKSILQIKGKGIAFLICCFVYLQPCYCFYQDNFHICATTFNIFIIGLSYLIYFFYGDGNNRKFNLGLIFLTLAALIRFIQLIPIIALLATFVVISIKNKRFENKVIYIMISISCVLSYFAYNQMLAKTYGSVFLNYPDYIKSLKDAIIQIIHILRVYPRVVLPPPYLFLFVSLTYLFIKQLSRKKVLNIFFIWIGINIIGSFLFSAIMLENVGIHEYYSIDVWLPVLTTLLIYMLFNIDFSKVSILKRRVALILLFVASLFFVFKSQYKRYDPVFSNQLNGGEDLIIQSFKESRTFLDKHISTEDKVLVICESGRNIPQMGWPRDVFRIGGHTFQYYSDIMTKKYDAIVTYNKTFNQKLLKYHPEFMSGVKMVKSNGKVTIWKQN